MTDRPADTFVGSFNKPERAASPLRALHALNALLLVGLWLFVVLAYGSLPDQIPHHLGAGGQVTRAGGRGIWLLLPIMMSVNIVVIYGIALSFTTAAGFNVPHKKRLLALPRAAQRQALEPARVFMFGMATWLIVLSWALQLEIYHAAFAGRGSGYMLPFTVAFTVIPLAGMWWLGRAIKRRIDEFEVIGSA